METALTGPLVKGYIHLIKMQKQTFKFNRNWLNIMKVSRSSRKNRHIGPNSLII